MTTKAEVERGQEEGGKGGKGGKGQPIRCPSCTASALLSSPYPSPLSPPLRVAPTHHLTLAPLMPSPPSRPLATGYNLETKQRLSYAEIKTILEGIKDRYGWDPIMEDGNIIGLRLNGQSVTLEPGGQFELSGATLETLHETCAEVNSHLYQVKSISEEIGVAFLGLGFDPKWKYEDVPCMPKERYNIMKNYMPTKGELGRDMMFRSCTIQVRVV